MSDTKRVLLVDDEVQIAELFKMELDDENFETVITFCGNDAIEILKEEKNFDVIITDYKMANGSGLDVLDYVLESTTVETKPYFIFVTGESSFTKEKSISLGANDVFIKPFDVEDLIDRLKECTNQERLAS